jgi:hypothetical protein
VALAHRRAGALPRDPVGLLTHHLDHDDAAWTFLEWFVAWAGPRFEWVDLSAAAAPR